MIETKPQQIDKQTWNKVSFYVDIIVFIVIAISIYLLILNAYEAGKIASTQYGGDQLSSAWINVARDIAFLAFGLAWIFFRLYSYRGIVARRYW
ncbi:MAG: hypothetical protein QXX20_03950 [Candidatus Thermoplasmatota archaeon]